MQYKNTVVLFLLLSTILSINLSAQAPDTIWTKTFGGADLDRGLSVQQTSDGGYIVAGYTESFGYNLSDAWLIKTNGSGDTLWTRTFGWMYPEKAHSVQQTSDGGYIVAGYTESYGAGENDVWLIKTNDSGDTLWTNTFGGAEHDRGYSVQQTSDGGYIVAGETGSFGADSFDVYLVKTDSSGNLIWEQTFGGTDDDYGRSVQQTSDGGYIVTGFTESYGGGQRDLYLIKTDSLGDTLWTNTFGGADDDYCLSIQQTSDGGYIMTGTTRSYGGGWADAWLVKTDGSGDTLWTNTFGGTENDFGISVQQRSDGGYIIAGVTSSYGAGNSDAWLIKTDASGDTLWTNTYGGIEVDYSSSVKETSDGGYIISGYTESYGAGSNDVWLIKTEPDLGVKERVDLNLKTPAVRLECYPNPFFSSTTLSLRSVPENRRNGETVIEVYDVTGRVVREISLLPFCFYLGAEATWDGRDEAGKVLPPGIYFLKAGGTPVGKVVKVR